MNDPQNPNPNFNFLSDENFDPFIDNFDLSNLIFDNGLIEEETSSPTSIVSSETFTGESSGSGKLTWSNKEFKRSEEIGHKIAFRTRSKIDVMDDGYKWRKYGKKSVKNNINKRNYYKCTSEGCKVKKRVERDGEDESYVITTYEGVHNHQSPSHIYINDDINDHVSCTLQNWTQHTLLLH